MPYENLPLAARAEHPRSWSVREEDSANSIVDFYRKDLDETHAILLSTEIRCEERATLVECETEPGQDALGLCAACGLRRLSLEPSEPMEEILWSFLSRARGEAALEMSN